LGLSMVYELAKALGYGLEVETHRGEGSAFSIIIPVVQKKTQPDPASPPDRSETTDDRR
jgi:signal transduction histidine kinase